MIQIDKINRKIRHKLNLLRKNHLTRTLFSAILSILFTFQSFFQKGMYISAADFLYIWYPWASVKPNGFTAVKNSIVSDWVDSLVPSFYTLTNSNFWEIINGYKISSNWGHPNPGMLGGITLHEPLLFLFSHMFDYKLGMNLLFISKVLLSFLGQYLLSRKLKINKNLALLAASFLAFSIPLFGNIYGGAILGLTILPWIFLILTKLSEEFKTINIILYIGSIIWLITSGFPTTITYGVIFSLLFFCLLTIKNANYSKKTKQRIIVYFFIINLLILGLWAWSLLPNISNLKSMDLGYRDGNGLKKLASKHFLQWIYPNYCGNGTSIPWICGAGNWIETSMSSGIVSVLVLFTGIPALFYLRNRNRAKSIYFYLITTLIFCLIFNWLGISKITNLIPLLNINSNTRLIFLLPFFVTNAGTLSINQIMQRYPNNRKKTHLIWIILLVSITSYLVFNFAKLQLHFKSLSPEIIRSELTHYSMTIIPALFLILTSILTKSKKLRNTIIIVLFFLSTIDLYHYNSAFISYQNPEEIFPITEGIKYLQENMQSQDRILTIERVLLPNTNEVYGLNALTGHDWRTTNFNKAMQIIQPNIFANAGTLEFWDRERIILNKEIQNYLEFNRVKYLVQSPNALVPEYNLVFEQPYIEKYEELEYPIEYQIPLLDNEKISSIRISAIDNNKDQETLESSNFEIFLLSETGKTKLEITNLYENSLENNITIEFEENNVDSNNRLSIIIQNSEGWNIGLWKSRDLNPDTVITNKDDIYEISLLTYNLEEKVYDSINTGDLLISKVSDSPTTAYFYPCYEQSESQCKQALSQLEINSFNDLDTFNKLYSDLIQIPILNYDAGNIEIDTSNIERSGILFLSDNYFNGWNSKQGEVFSGLLGCLSVYTENPTEKMTLNYTNEYLLLGSIISLTSIILLAIFLSKMKITDQQLDA